MKKTILLLAGCCCAFALTVAVSGQTHQTSTTPLNIEQTFREPGRAAEPWTYWIWINGNVTKEGIRADLEDMRRVGIGGAMLFDGSLYLPTGPVRYGSDSWHEHIQYTLKTASEFGIKIAMMNCAGWATSGGPWNDVEHSMKMLVWSEQAVSGKTNGAGTQIWRGKLPQPPSQLGYYRDVAVIAVPDATESEPLLTNEITGKPVPELADYDGATFADFAQATKFRLAFSKPETMRRLEIDLVRSNHEESIEGWGSDDDLTPAGLIEASDDERVFRTVKKFAAGKQEFGSRVEINFDAATAKYFRVTLSPRPGGVAATVLGSRAAAPKPWRIAELRLANSSRIDDLPGKTGLKTLPPLRPSEWSADVSGEISSKNVIDLTERLSPDGALEWNVPEGHWTILRFGYTTSARKNHPSPPEGEGLEVDKFDSESVEHHFESALGRVIREADPKSTRALAGVLCDSWEAGPQTWTGKLPDIFVEKRGYSLRRYLPVLTGRVVDSPQKSEIFLADYRRTIGELYAENYYGTMQRKCAQYGMRFFAEAYGGVLDEPRAIEHLDVPMTEFWTFGLYKGFDYAPSVAHLMGKPIVGAEAFTGRPPRARWGEHPYSLKTLGDAAYAAGINSFVLHSYVHQPRTDYAPGFTHGRYGTHFGRLNSWWPLAPSWIDYLQRCQFLLQHGRPVADILCLRDERLQTEYRELLTPALAGYQSDLISVSQLHWLDVDRNGMLCTKAGATYRVLALPQTWIASTETLRHLARLKKAGATISGPPPFAAAARPDTEGEGAKQWRKALNAVFGDGACARSLQAAVRVPADFQVRARSNAGGSETADIRFVHRVATDGDYYFLTNQTKRTVNVDAVFRVKDRHPELWNPIDGKIAEAPSYRIENGCTIVPLALGETESVFVVFRKPLPTVWPVAITPNGTYASVTPGYGVPGCVFPEKAGSYKIEFSNGSFRTESISENTTLAVQGPWKLSFKSATHRSPAPITLDTLTSLDQHTTPEIRYFSGLVTYENTMNIDAASLDSGKRIFLNLGAVHDMARVTINGKIAGTSWMPPHVLDITDFTRAGLNALTITVANRWVNRLIGDEQLPSDLEYGTQGSAENALQKFPAWWDDVNAFRKRERQTFATWKHYEAISPLAPSGLTGPVTIVSRPTLMLIP